MVTLSLAPERPSHTQRLVQAAARGGWRALVIPASGKLKPSRQLIEFRTSTRRVRVRFSIFSVGDRGEPHRRDERRIQITTTYLSGLERVSDCIDVVLGYDSVNKVYVGLDARRLEFGGGQHNASSSVDATALEDPPVGSIRIRPHDTQILGLEYQAIFYPSQLAEYVFNVDSIHRGLYAGNGWFSGSAMSAGQGATGSLTVPSENAYGEVLVLGTSATPRPKHKVRKSRIRAYENGDWQSLADLSPEELEAIRRKCLEIGDRGEYFVLRFERQRLRKAGKAALAKGVDWVSRRAIGKGYDIKSYEADGSPRYIEVKSTAGKGMTFLMSDYEWRVAAREKNAYYIYRVVDVDRDPTLKRVVQNPVATEAKKQIERTAVGWKIKLK